MFRYIISGLQKLRPRQGAKMPPPAALTPPPVQRHDMPAAQQQSHFMRDFLQSHRPCEASMQRYASIDWTSRILADSAYQAIPFFPRFLNGATGENTLVAATMNTSTTIPHVLALRRRDLRTPDASTVPVDDGHVPKHAPDVQSLWSLGPDLASHAEIVQGGFQGVIFDEVMRLVVLLHYDNVCSPGPRRRQVTAGMTLTYVRPVLHSRDVLVRAWLVGREGRKWFVEAEIVGSSGEVLTKAKSVWATIKVPE